MSIPSADTKLAALKLFGYSALNAARVAEGLGCTVASARRQLSELERLGLIVAHDERGFILTRTGALVVKAGALTPQSLLACELERIVAEDLDLGWDETSSRLVLRALDDPYSTPSDWRSLHALLRLVPDRGGRGPIDIALAAYAIGHADGEEEARELASQPSVWAG